MTFRDILEECEIKKIQDIVFNTGRIDEFYNKFGCSYNTLVTDNNTQEKEKLGDLLVFHSCNYSSITLELCFCGFDCVFFIPSRCYGEDFVDFRLSSYAPSR